MPISPTTRHWATLAGLWLWVAMSGTVILVQLFMVQWDVGGHWTLPGVSHVTVRVIERDEEGLINGSVLAEVEGQVRKLRLLREEAAELKVDDERWVLNHYRSGGQRPNQFLLTPWRLMAEYPEPLMALALWAIVRLRRRFEVEAKARAQAPNPNRKVWKDDFHTRAQRFGKPEDPEAP